MDTLIPIGLFLIIQMLIQHYQRKAQAMLSTEEKAKLLDGSSQFDLMQTAPAVILLLAFGGFMYLKPSISIMSVGLAVFILLLAASSVISQRMMFKRLSTIGLPEDYVKRRGRLALIQSATMMVIFAWILGSTLWTLRGLQG